MARTSRPQPACSGTRPQPGAQPARRVVQHRTPVRVVPAPSGTDRPGAGRQPGEGVGQPAVLPAQQVDRERCRRGPLDQQLGQRGVLVEQPEHLGRARRRPAGTTTASSRRGRPPAAAVQTLTGAGIRPRNRRSGSRSASGGANGWLGVDGHRTSSTVRTGRRGRSGWRDHGRGMPDRVDPVYGGPGARAAGTERKRWYGLA